MPLYATKCQSCGRDDAVYRLVAERDVNIPDCVHCGGEMNRVVSAPFVAADMSPYRSMITGEMISSRSQHRDHLKAHNCIEIGNETKYLKPKEKIDLTPESKKARKQKIIDQVNALK
jgi:putative FmdB family regulatory protein